MNKYETIMIINPDLTDEECAKVVEKITDMISREGKIESTEVWGRKKLAYPIRKKNEGYYVMINFEHTPDFINELNRVYNITDEILKHIIIQRDN